ncbi:MAG: hypothetical protein LLG04_17635 [Parachlamydia sp.]|nr:hypothetical protein [Parachlamydia sp.]
MEERTITDRITTIATVIIAITALGVSIWQGIETRKHNRLSVRPHLVFLTDFSPQDSELGIYIKNNGVGPAYIKDVEISVNGKVIPNSSCNWKSILNSLNIPDLAPWMEWLCFNEGASIKNDEVIGLLTVKRENITKEKFESLKKAISQIDIQIRYVSSYEDCFSLKYKKVKAQP